MVGWVRGWVRGWVGGGSSAGQGRWEEDQGRLSAARRGIFRVLLFVSWVCGQGKEEYAPHTPDEASKKYEAKLRLVYLVCLHLMRKQNIRRFISALLSSDRPRLVTRQLWSSRSFSPGMSIARSRRGCLKPGRGDVRKRKQGRKKQRTKCTWFYYCPLLLLLPAAAGSAAI